jgi:hypothetical protein
MRESKLTIRTTLAGFVHGIVAPDGPFEIPSHARGDGLRPAGGADHRLWRPCRTRHGRNGGSVRRQLDPSVPNSEFDTSQVDYQFGGPVTGIRLSPK